MPNIPYASVSSDSDDPVVKAIVERRGARGLTPLDLMLLHSPSVASGWNTFLGTIRTKTSLPADVREVAICRVAALNKADYEWQSHAPIAIEAGVSEQDMQIVRKGNAEDLKGRLGLVLRYTDAMTKNVTVLAPLFEEVKEAFDEQGLVELTATIGCYNMVSRFLVALGVS